MPTVGRILIFVIALLLLVGCGGAQAGERQGQKASSVESEVSSFPLANALPSKSYAKLDGGRLHRGKWAAFVYRGRGSKVCLNVLSATARQSQSISVVSGSPSCRNAGDHASRLAVGLSTGEPRLRILALALDSRAKKVELEFSTGGTAIHPTRFLTDAKQSKVMLHNFPYIVERERPPDCSVHLKTFGASGNVIGSSPLAPC